MHRLARTMAQPVVLGLPINLADDGFGLALGFVHANPHSIIVFLNFFNSEIAADNVLTFLA